MIKLLLAEDTSVRVEIGLKKNDAKFFVAPGVRETFLAKAIHQHEKESDQMAHKKWFAHIGPYGTFFDYHFHRAELFAKMGAIAVSNRQTVALEQPGAAQINVNFVAPFRGKPRFLSQTVDLHWQ